MISKQFGKPKFFKSIKRLKELRKNKPFFKLSPCLNILSLLRIIFEKFRLTYNTVLWKSFSDIIMCHSAKHLHSMNSYVGKVIFWIGHKIIPNELLKNYNWEMQFISCLKKSKWKEFKSISYRLMRLLTSHVTLGQGKEEQ